MIPAIARFVEALRAEGIEASPAEVLDAARAVECLGLEERARFRAALASTLAKGRRAREIFDRVFERFFAPPARSPGRGHSGRGGDQDRESRRSGAGESGSAIRPKRETRPRKSEARQRNEPRRGRDAEQGGELEKLRRELDRARERGARRESRLRRVESGRDREPKRASAAGPSTQDPLRRVLTAPMASEEERRLARLVPRLVEQLRLRKSRRLRRSRRGRIWTRQVFRENLGRGGTPFVLPYRRPRPRRPKVTLLVDVSRSVSRVAGYFLSIALEFLRPGRRTRVILFIDRPVDATAAIARWGRGRSESDVPPARARGGRRVAAGIVRRGISFADLLESVGGLNPAAASDYGRTFHALLSSHLRPQGRQTILVILGDARTNRFDPLPWAFEEIARRSKAVLWLVPEPEPRWGTGDSALGAYLGSVDVVVEASDLLGLTRGVAELLKNL